MLIFVILSLINFLNSVYFLQINKKIISLELQSNEFFEIDKIYNDLSTRADIVCKCKIQNLHKKEFEISNIYVDIQIGLKNDIDKRLLKYGNEIFKLSVNEKIPINTYVLCIILESDEKIIQASKEINLYEKPKNSLYQDNFGYTQIIKINLYNEIIRIFKQSFTSSCNDADEWLKFIGLRFWCNKNQNDLFILPADSPSHNSYINLCCCELRTLDKFMIDKIYEIENHDKKIIDETKIIVRFECFKTFGKFIKLKGGYTEYQIRQILKEEYNSIDDASKIEEFIKENFG